MSLKAKKSGMKPSFLLFSAHKFFLVNALSYNLEVAISYASIKSVLVDKSEKGLFCVDQGTGMKPLYLLAAGKAELQTILNALESSRNQAKQADPSLSSLLVNIVPLLEGDEVAEADSSVLVFSFYNL